MGSKAEAMLAKSLFNIERPYENKWGEQDELFCDDKYSAERLQKLGLHDFKTTVESLLSLTDKEKEEFIFVMKVAFYGVGSNELSAMTEKEVIKRMSSNRRFSTEGMDSYNEFTTATPITDALNGVSKYIMNEVIYSEYDPYEDAFNSVNPDLFAPFKLLCTAVGSPTNELDTSVEDIRVWFYESLSLCETREQLEALLKLMSSNVHDFKEIVGASSVDDFKTLMILLFQTYGYKKAEVMKGYSYAFNNFCEPMKDFIKTYLDKLDAMESKYLNKEQGFISRYKMVSLSDNFSTTPTEEQDVIKYIVMQLMGEEVEMVNNKGASLTVLNGKDINNIIWDSRRGGFKVSLTAERKIKVQYPRDICDMTSTLTLDEIIKKKKYAFHLKYMEYFNLNIFTALLTLITRESKFTTFDSEGIESYLYGAWRDNTPAINSNYLNTLVCLYSFIIPKIFDGLDCVSLTDGKYEKLNAILTTFKVPYDFELDTCAIASTSIEEIWTEFDTFKKMDTDSKNPNCKAFENLLIANILNLLANVANKDNQNIFVNEENEMKSASIPSDPLA